METRKIRKGVTEADETAVKAGTGAVGVGVEASVAEAGIEREVVVETKVEIKGVVAKTEREPEIEGGVAAGRGEEAETDAVAVETKGGEVVREEEGLGVETEMRTKIGLMSEIGL